MLDADFAAAADDNPNGIDAFPMTGDPGQPTLFRPPAVAVHNDGYVPGDIASGKHFGFYVLNLIHKLDVTIFRR